LIHRIGAAELERLEGPQVQVKCTSDDLKAIRDEYRAKTRGIRATD
jgi:dihydroxyacetone kinase